MKRTRCLRIIGVFVVVIGGMQVGSSVHASFRDTIGVTVLRTVTTNLNGAGIRVAQPEATDVGQTNYEVRPAAVGQPEQLFTYYSSYGTAANYPNNVGTESGHADGAGSYFYGLPGGVATNIAHVDNYDADYFVQVYYSVPSPGVTNYTASLPSSNIEDSVVNQSFIFNDSTVAIQQAIDSAYDNYAVQYNTLFVSGAGNGGPVAPPSTSYNGISVGAYLDGTNYSSIGPTLDNGRAKPDITAPQEETSYSTPQVAGAAALLMQAGLRGDGGSDTNGAADVRTVKALLLNGAVKPADWTNDPPSPLDPRYGAGVLNVFNSYEQLVGGKHSYIASTTVSTGNPHPPNGASGTVSALSGWDFNTISSSVSSDKVYHYYFDVTNDVGGAPFTATATLVWNRQRNKTDINNLDLFLYNAVSSNLVAASTSVVDNVEHIWLPQLPQGRYDLQVLKHGGRSAVSSSETYALAWEFFSTSLNDAHSGTNVVLTWPIYPDGFVVETSTNLTPPIIWTALNVSPTVTNGQNQVTVNAADESQFFRLNRPGP